MWLDARKERDYRVIRYSGSREDLGIEDSVTDSWSKDLEILEVPIANRILFVSAVALVAAGFLVIGRVAALASQTESFTSKSEANLLVKDELPAPRGLIYDRNGELLVENEPSFLLFVESPKFFRNFGDQTKTLSALQEILGLEPGEISLLLQKAALSDQGSKVLVAASVTQSQVIKLRDLNIDSLVVGTGFKRVYQDGPIYSSVVGYTGLVNAADLEGNPSLSRQAVVGRAGLEAYYDDFLRGTPGAVIQFRNAKGEILSEPEEKKPAIGQSLHLTIDGDFQSYFFRRFEAGLASLGRSAGVGLAIRPSTGEMLSLFTFPAFDNNIFVAPGRNEEKKNILTSPLTPLFNRAISGEYNPGSTIKPLVGVAALRERVISPEREIFSPGYLEVSNPYRPEEPTRFLDWRYQGNVNMISAIAQSSNVYFYTVGGGFGDVRGLGVSRLREWWEKFHFGAQTGVDLPGESQGFLPDPREHEVRAGRPWLLGDTYNVSIGQGDLLVTPLQLLSYIAALANGGRMYEPRLVSDSRTPTVIQDLSSFAPEITTVVEGMGAAVTAPLGTAHLLADLPFRVAAKTGSAQVKNNTAVNAFFVGFAPVEKPEIAVLVLIENSVEGSLNAVPIAKDVLNWYYWNRIKNSF